MNEEQTRTAISVLEFLENEAAATRSIFMEMYVEHKNRHEEVPPRIYKGMSRTQDIQFGLRALRKHLNGDAVPPSYAHWFEITSKETA